MTASPYVIGGALGLLNTFAFATCEARARRDDRVREHGRARRATRRAAMP